MDHSAALDLLAELHAGRIARCWLLPLDPVEFDDIWSGVTA